MKDPIYLSPTTNCKSFFEKVKVGDIVQYSFFYNFSDIKHIAKNCRVTIKRLLPYTKEYQIFGSCIFKIVKKHNSKLDLKPDLKPVMFDPKMLSL